MKDMRSYEIKKILKKKYPGSVFRVRIDKYSLGESINIYTDLLQQLPERFNQICWKIEIGEEETTEEERRIYFEGRRILEENKKYEDEIKSILKDFWHINYDEMGEILNGGNTYLYICSLVG